MKGISDVVAMLLMLVIAIGLVGVTYSFISTTITTRKAVILNQDGEGRCLAGETVNSIIFWIRNEGDSKATGLTAADVPTNPSKITNCSFDPSTIDPYSGTTVTCNRTEAKAGLYEIRISASGATPIFARVRCSG